MQKNRLACGHGCANESGSDCVTLYENESGGDGGEEKQSASWNENESGYENVSDANMSKRSLGKDYIHGR